MSAQLDNAHHAYAFAMQSNDLFRASFTPFMQQLLQGLKSCIYFDHCTKKGALKNQPAKVQSSAFRTNKSGRLGIYTPFIPFYGILKTWCQSACLDGKRTRSNMTGGRFFLTSNGRQCMMIKSINMLVAGLIAVGTLAGCAINPTIGSKQGDVPPRIIVDPANSKLKIWDKPGAFGPLPADKTALGQQVCSRLNTQSLQYKAIGYHPLAKDIDGKTYPEGGFFCVAK